MATSGDLVLGLDVGTTLVKAHVLDAAGRTVVTATSRPIDLSTPQPGYAEQDPEQVWAAVVTVLAEVSARLGDGTALAGLAMATQSGSLLAIGDDEVPLTPLITWKDTRSQPLIERWQREGIDRSIRACSGWSPAPGLGLANIIWLSERRPQLRAGIRRFVGIDSFVAHRLTGTWATNPSNAAGMQLMDVGAGEWSRELCELAGVEIDLLPRIRATGSELGRIRLRAAKETGLAPGMPVINGGHDQACSALALGVVQPPDLFLATGTAWVLTGAVPAGGTVGDGFNVAHHVVDGARLASRYLGGLGAEMEALLDAHYPPTGVETRAGRYTRLDRAAAATEPAGPLDHRPGGAGEVGDDGGRSARSLMERAAYEAELALADLRQATGPPPSITVVGGAAASPVWPQILADVTAIPVEVGGAESWPAIGAAAIAGRASGLEEGGAGWMGRPQFRSLQPNPVLTSRYQDRLAEYRAARQSRHTSRSC